MKAKKILSKVMILLICLSIASGLAIANTACDDINDQPLLRFHIRANSNSAADQSIKLTVRDSVLAFLTPLLEQTDSLDKANAVLVQNAAAIKAIANAVLVEGGFGYTASFKIDVEFFPARMYEDVLIQSGYFLAAVIGLGSGEGDNWWCVLYPPLCYLEAKGAFRYRSKILELVREIFG
ncbi:MAG: stage II sporulation protein R [Firmicutes bacterium]|nr:stage II sporulation protein R [Bacillota bacterium]